MKLFDSFRSMFAIPELKRRLIFTGIMIAVYRIGSHVPTPGINGRALQQYMEAMAQQGGSNLFGLYDLFVGGNFSKATIFALGIMPYISASIIFQLLGALVPFFQKLQKEGEEGRRKINQYTRVSTVGLCLLQSGALSGYLVNLSNNAASLGSSMGAIVPHPGLAFTIMTMLTLTTGTIFVMWLGEQITERGIGNGISLIIFIGICARYLRSFIQTIQSIVNGQLEIFKLLLFALAGVAVIALVVAMTQAQRKVPVQYAQRRVGPRLYRGGSTNIPLRPNTAGVIPIIFAQSILILPATIAASLFHDSDFSATFQAVMSPGSLVYSFLYTVIILFFAYFYTAIVLNPVELADNLKKQGGFIPGVRPGKKTAQYIDRILTRITLPGAFYLAFIAVLPDWILSHTNLPFYFGGTGLLIVVGVALDTLSQIESYLLMRHYEGFMTRGRLKARRT